MAVIRLLFAKLLNEETKRDLENLRKNSELWEDQLVEKRKVYKETLSYNNHTRKES